MKNAIKTINLLVAIFLIASNTCYAELKGKNPSPSNKEFITGNSLVRVFFIKYKDKTGTAFTIDVDDKQYLLTAKHVVKGIKNGETIEIYHDNQWKEILVKIINCTNPDVDIIILVPPFQLSPAFPFSPSSHGIVLSQEVFFLGFPYGMVFKDNGINRSFPLPFIKKGILSAIDSSIKDRVVLYIDGFNNPGFSGGPIVFVDLRTKELKVAGVIQSYKVHPDKVMNKNIDTGLVAISNSGIVIGFCIDSAVAAIKNNPIGIEIKK